MACGCSGSGTWQAQGFVPADTQDPSYFWSPSTHAPTSDLAEDAPRGKTPAWNPDTGKSEDA